MQIFSDKLVEVISMDDDFVWIHDYHLLVLPSLLRKRFHRLRCGLFLHSPFPSSEIWRTFPKREELLRSLLNVDLIGDSPGHSPSAWPDQFGACMHLGFDAILQALKRGPISLVHMCKYVRQSYLMPLCKRPNVACCGNAYPSSLWHS